MRSLFRYNQLALVVLLTLLGVTGGTWQIQPKTIAAPVAEAQTQEIDRLMAEGERLLNEGSAESLQKAIVQFKKALQLARSAQMQDRQANSLLILGRLQSRLGNKKKALDYYNQALPIFRKMSDRLVTHLTLAITKGT